MDFFQHAKINDADLKRSILLLDKLRRNILEDGNALAALSLERILLKKFVPQNFTMPISYLPSDNKYERVFCQTEDFLFLTSRINNEVLIWRLNPAGDKVINDIKRLVLELISKHYKTGRPEEYVNFYTNKKWNERGEDYCQTADLIMTSGNYPTFFEELNGYSNNRSATTEFYEIFNSQNQYSHEAMFELGTGWYGGFYANCGIHSLEEGEKE